jgi:glycosyltransferase A (GT-A) superfamily protein (DUF2064 family)
MKSVAVATFVKTPGKSPIKTRLAKEIGVTRALEFYITSLNETYKTVETLKSKSTEAFSIQPYWAVAEEASLKNPFWAKWPCVFQGEGDLGERIAKVYTELREKHDVVVLFGADSPHITSSRLLAAITPVVSGQASTCVGPTEDGGFYVLASSLKIPEKIWTSVAYSKTDTLVQLKNVWPATWLEIEKDYDVDTLADLTRLAVEDAVFNKFQN